MSDGTYVPVVEAAENYDASVRVESDRAVVISEDPTGESDGASDLLADAQAAGFSTSPAFDVDAGVMAWEVTPDQGDDVSDPSSGSNRPHGTQAAEAPERRVNRRREEYMDNRLTRRG